MSRLPLEQMIASFLPAPASSKAGTKMGAVWTVMALTPFPKNSHAAAGLWQTRDVGHLLGRLLGKKREQFLDRYPGKSGHAAQGRGFSLGEVVLPQEADRFPMR